MRIYLCGHGNHHLVNGFFTLPRDTTVTFYTMPFKLIHQGDTQSIVAGKAMTPDRIVEPLRSCPNLTLSCDSDKDKILTHQAWKDNPDRANTKLFSVNELIKGAGEDSEMSMTLKEIVEAAPGHDYVWCCCYHIPLAKTLLGAKYGMNVNQYVKGGDLYDNKVRFGAVGGIDINTGSLVQQVRAELRMTAKELPQKAALKALHKMDSPQGLPARKPI